MKQPGERVGWDQETRSPGANERGLDGVGLVLSFFLVWLSSRWAGRMWLIGIGTRRVRTALAARATAWRRSIATRRAVWSPVSRAFVGIAAWAIASGRAFRLPMATSFFTIVERRTHFIAIATAWAVKGISARRAIETSVD